VNGVVKTRGDTSQKLLLACEEESSRPKIHIDATRCARGISVALYPSHACLECAFRMISDSRTRVARREMPNSFHSTHTRKGAPRARARARTHIGR